EAWIRSRARETSSSGQHKLKIRIGTFNVNGKLPSQDLSQWVAGQTSPDSSAPTLTPPPEKNSTDEDRNVDDHVKEASGASSTSTTSVRSDLDTDPDLLVLGFQELDLSTEALVYSLGSAREDAWCQAVLAALGEKRDLYEK
ncbi:hypothetical protein H0H93_003184, partial [Arthromyces matolae]